MGNQDQVVAITQKYYIPLWGKLEGVHHIIGILSIYGREAISYMGCVVSLRTPSYFTLFTNIRILLINHGKNCPYSVGRKEGCSINKKTRVHLPCPVVNG